MSMSMPLQQMLWNIIIFTFGLASFLLFGFALLACEGVGGAAV
jgi:hypothetical protein